MKISLLLIQMTVAVCSWRFAEGRDPYLRSSGNRSMLLNPMAQQPGGGEFDSADPSDLESRWRVVPGFVRHLYQSIADERGFVRNANSQLVQNSTAVWTFTNKVKGRKRRGTNRLEFAMHALFQPKKSISSLPKIRSAVIRLYRKPLAGGDAAGRSTGQRPQRPRHGDDERVRVTLNYHATRRSAAVPIMRSVTSPWKHGWETLELTAFLQRLQSGTQRRRRLSLSLDVETISSGGAVNRTVRRPARSYAISELFDLESQEPSTVPLLTVYLRNKTGQIEELVPLMAASSSLLRAHRRRRESSGHLRPPQSHQQGSLPQSHQRGSPTQSHQRGSPPAHLRGYCKMQDMEINFAADLQWKEILTPRLIRPNDCVGTCDIMVGEVKNNAVLRHWHWQYVQDSRGYAPLSCIPTRFALVTMLSYVNGVYELLPFPDMVALECGCA